jgi:hypothetical protein
MILHKVWAAFPYFRGSGLVAILLDVAVGQKNRRLWGLCVTNGNLPKKDDRPTYVNETPRRIGLLRPHFLQTYPTCRQW